MHTQAWDKDHQSSKKMHVFFFWFKLQKRGTHMPQVNDEHHGGDGGNAKENGHWGYSKGAVLDSGNE